jgi:hypothetical protein
MIDCNTSYAFGEVSKVGDKVNGKTLFYLKHMGSEQYLSLENAIQYNHQNCPRCPIVGHREVHCQPHRVKQALWKVHSGFFFPEAEEESPDDDEFIQ